MRLLNYHRELVEIYFSFRNSYIFKFTETKSHINLINDENVTLMHSRWVVNVSFTANTSVDQKATQIHS